MRKLTLLERAPPKAAPRRLKSTWDTRQALILVGVAITVVGLGWVTVLYVFRPRVIDPERLALIDSWRLWHDLSYALDQRPMWEQMYLDSLAKYRRWMVVACSTTGIGVLVMAGSVLLRARRPSRPRRRPPPKARDPGLKAGA